ncbi:MAG: ATP-binding protein [Bacteroidales bacterium]|nr:ATP-binding protein [Bacteroidales bacterium]MDY6001620.1 ATP-binding protein [Candidatus Cryptobacteroides sp.]
MIERLVTGSILNDYKKGKVIILLGPRQVGKTTLLEKLKEGNKNVLSINCDDRDDARLLEGKSSAELRQLLSPYDLVAVDEAQRVENIGLTIKMIGDLKLKAQVVVTGSSSLDMSSKINEPATGRTIEYQLFPFSLPELAKNHGERNEQNLLESRMIYGLYPEVVNEPQDAKRTLINLADKYLYKDLFSFKGIRKPELVENLVRALALQVGNEVSYNELSDTLGVDKTTVENYIGLLEKCFVVFRLGSFSRNKRDEIKKGKKIYFYDNGIRNAVIRNFAPLDLRNDTGALWENLMVSERFKHNSYSMNYANIYFWRTHSRKEIDLVEERDGLLSTYEFKWKPSKKASIPKDFSESYPNSSFTVITPDNLWPFLESPL